MHKIYTTLGNIFQAHGPLKENDALKISNFGFLVWKWNSGRIECVQITLESARVYPELSEDKEKESELDLSSYYWPGQ